MAKKFLIVRKSFWVIILLKKLDPASRSAAVQGWSAAIHGRPGWCVKWVPEKPISYLLSLGELDFFFRDFHLLYFVSLTVPLYL